MELAGYLNDTSLLLQAIVQCYGLLAPFLHFKLPSLPVVQVCSLSAYEYATANDFLQFIIYLRLVVLHEFVLMY